MRSSHGSPTLRLAEEAKLSPTTAPERVRRLGCEGDILVAEARLNPDQLGEG